jgi:hypothetical protein
VLCCMHTAWWAGWLCVCAKCLVSGLCLALSGSARQSWSYLLCCHFSSNATWHNSCFVVLVCRELGDDQVKIKWRSSSSLSGD